MLMHCLCQHHFTCSPPLPLVHLSPPPAVLSAAEKQQLAVLEVQLAWMVSIVGSVIRGRLSSSSSSSSAESQESLDGELSARVFGLLRVLDAGIHAQVNGGTYCILYKFSLVIVF